MDIENLTVKELRQVASLAHALTGSPTHGGDVFPFMPGAILLVRTVTHYYVGRLHNVDTAGLVLSDVAWVPDTGRFNTAVRDGVVNEAEPYPDGVLVYVSRGAVVDVAPFKSTLRLVK